MCPLPTAKTGEKESEFISRCLNDTEMKKEFPKADQRAAVCNGQWEKKSIQSKIREIRKKIKDTKRKK